MTHAISSRTLARGVALVAMSAITLVLSTLDQSTRGPSVTALLLARLHDFL